MNTIMYFYDRSKSGCRDAFVAVDDCRHGKNLHAGAEVIPQPGDYVLAHFGWAGNDIGDIDRTLARHGLRRGAQSSGTTFIIEGARNA